RDLSACTESDVTDFFADVGRGRNIEEWQLRRAVDSLELLLVDVLALPWAGKLDWEYWRDSARKLERSHPTIAREITPPDAARPGDSDRPLRAALITELRRRAYSVRTEQAYVHWIRRFIKASGNRDPRILGATDVKAFLEGLAVQGNVAPSTQNQALSALVFLYR